MTETHPQAVGHFIDPLAEELWAARYNRRAIEPQGPWLHLSGARANAIGQELYDRLGCDYDVWKLGALDVKTQQQSGLQGPLAAPVARGDARFLVGETTIDLDDFIAPRFEAEIGLLQTAAGLQVLACVEVLDCRFAGWRLPKYGPIADFGLQGLILFGPPQGSLARVRVDIRRDGEDVVHGSARVSEATTRLQLLPRGRTQSERYVATGTIVPPQTVTPGRWEFDFHDAGRLALAVS